MIKAFLISLIFGVFTVSSWGEKQQTKKTSIISNEQYLVASYISTPPVINGKNDDACWNNETYHYLIFFTADEQEITVKVAYDKQNIYTLITYPDKNESREHHPWIWDHSLNAYIQEKKEEDTVSLIWTTNPIDFSKADVWIWRAGRTDPLGYADDYFCYRDYIYSGDFITGKQDIRFLPDQGKMCWFSKYVGRYSGKKIQRFYCQTPEGSAADVHAKGVWRDGVWTIEFSRKLTTHERDDINFRKTPLLYMQFQLSPPKAFVKNYQRFYKVFLKDINRVGDKK
jgi:hypothetical protein